MKIEKKFLAIFISVLVVNFIYACFAYSSEDIRAAARRSSVQTVFHVPVLRVSFATPLSDKESLTKDTIEELLAEQKALLEKKFERLLEQKEQESTENKHESGLTTIEKYGYESPAKTYVPLQSIIPDDAKLPKNVLITCKITESKENLKAWEKEYEKDILIVSETLGVSPSQATSLISNLALDGYTVSKDVVEQSEDIELLWFRTWNSSPITLEWKVCVEGTDVNIIKGYLPELGVLEVKPIPEDKKVYVKAGYFALREKFKPKSEEVLSLERQLEDTKEDLQKAQEALEEEIAKDKKDRPKRDISKVTWIDVKYGNVKLEEFQFITAASGIFLGNMQVQEEMSYWGGLRGWGYYQSDYVQKTVGVILTNAHVANMGMQFEIYVSRDKEVMWILFPGAPFIRYTKDSDFYGSPAVILGIHETPVVSWGCDAAIMVTSPVPAYEQYKAKLGNSDNVKEGDRVILCGNPAMMQKFSFEGVVTNTNYNVLHRLDAGVWMKYLNKPMYDWVRNSCMWIDAAGCGGTSGSGVTALQGQEAGKVISLHNMGLAGRDIYIGAVSTDNITFPVNNSLISETRDFKKLQKDFERVSYNRKYDDFIKEYPEFADALKQHGYHEIEGMNGGIPINRVKAFLQERGLDPDHFGWDGVDRRHWEQ